MDKIEIGPCLEKHTKERQGNIMENNRFFKLLWRANAIFLFVAGIMLVGMLATAAFFMIAELGGSDTPPPTAAASAEQSQENETFQLRPPSRNYKPKKADGFVYFELRSGTDSYGKLSSGSSSQLRNIAVFDLDKETTHWVFPDSQQEIESYKSVGKTVMSDDGTKTTITMGFLLTVAKSLPDRSISRDLWVMTPDGQTLIKILPNVSSPPDIATYGKGQTKLIIETKTDIDIYPFDVDRLTVGEATRISVP